MSKLKIFKQFFCEETCLGVLGFFDFYKENVDDLVK